MLSENSSGYCESFLGGEESMLQAAEIRDKKRDDDDGDVNQ